ncbi:MAG TPA: glycosyl transferase [Nevskiaceae bacterium]|nr:glycosyl transferase [Nevskiaceae bacterium]
MNDVIYQIGDGHYQAWIDEHGCGGAKLGDLALYRSGGDAPRDRTGFFIYLRDADSGRLWSAARRPVRYTPQHHRVHRAGAMLQIESGFDDIDSMVLLEANSTGEARTVRLRNRSARRRTIELTSYLEVIAGDGQADRAHPAFAKLFVQTARSPDGTGLVAVRRPRAGDEHGPALRHSLSGAPLLAWETDRCCFIGRGRNTARPLLRMRGTVGNVLDPMLSLRASVELPPGGEATVTFRLEAAAHFATMPATNADVSTPDAAVTGAFCNSGDEYRIGLPWQGDQPALPPMPWINVIANRGFGCMVSETGAGSTWSRNSQMHRLTPWFNDPVSDPHGEALYLRDEGSGEFWSPLPGPCPAPVDHQVHHGFGYSRFAAVSHQLEQDTTVFVAREDAVKFSLIRLHNRSDQARTLSLFSHQQLVLGERPRRASGVRTWRSGSWLGAQPPPDSAYAGPLTYGTAVADVAAEIFTGCDRDSFLGDGDLRAPQALLCPQLPGDQSGGEPCFTWQLRFRLGAGQSAAIAILLGEALDAAELDRVREQYASVIEVSAELDAVRAAWTQRLSRLRVRTPEPAIDRMVNGWLPYQAWSCRLWARSAYYQSSGAFGFRDQLQDAGNTCLLWPELARQQLLLHAGRQFAEGDVQHWWHEAPIDRGIRTRCSDDLLWLPYVACQYIERTGDRAVLDERAGFLLAPELAGNEADRYLQAERSTGTFSIYEHCCRAIERALTRGAHGLPLIGSCDWNDGYNRLGRRGLGESVWLAFFLHRVLDDFGSLAQARGDHPRAQRYAAVRAQLREALERHGWDGQWYRRAYDDDGVPLGTASSAECRIDGLAQSWAVLSGAAPDARAREALASADAQLVDEPHQLIRLLTPPFGEGAADPGYIKGYLAGVRENGGQYTHAACWLIEAMARAGRRDRAAHLLTLISPLQHTRSAPAMARYQLEPYVIAADIYGAEPHAGRGGWSWYTGSAGLAWRVAVEAVLGLRVEGGSVLSLRPCIPDEWPGYDIEYTEPSSSTRYCIEVVNADRCAQAIVAAQLDGVPVAELGQEIRWPLQRDGARHRVIVQLGRKPGAA